MVTWPITSRDPERSNSWTQYAFPPSRSVLDTVTSLHGRYSPRFIGRRPAFSTVPTSKPGSPWTTHPPSTRAATKILRSCIVRWVSFHPWVVSIGGLVGGAYKTRCDNCAVNFQFESYYIYTTFLRLHLLLNLCRLFSHIGYAARYFKETHLTTLPGRC